MSKRRIPGRFNDEIDAHKRALIHDAMAHHKGNKTRAARDLGLSRQGLIKLLKRFPIVTPDVPVEEVRQEVERLAIV